MTNTKLTSFSMLVAAGAVFCLMPSIVSAQPPAGDKAKRARGAGDRDARRGGATDPSQFAATVMAEHDKNADTELSVDELAEYLTTQRQRRGAQQGDGQRKSDGAGQRKGNPDDAARRQGRGRQGDAARQGDRPSDGQRNGRGGRRTPGGQGDTQDRNSGQIAAKLMAEFDKNGSNGLDVRELTSSIETQRQGRSRAGGPAEGDAGRKRGMQRDQADGRRSGKQDNAGSGKRKGAGDGRQGKRKGNREDSEPGTGVAPKRPTE